MNRGILSYIFLVFFGVSLAFFCGEAAVRAWKLFANRPESMEEALERAEHTALPTDSSGVASSNFAMGGLVKPSSYKDIVYELKPNISGTFQGRPLSINSFGIRDRDFDLKKPANTIRVAGIGDSVMFGWGVPVEDTYFKILEKQFNAPSSPKRFEFINFSVPGYNTSIEVAVYEHRVIPFDPDVVVVHFVNNDFGVPLFMQRPEDLFAFNRSYLIEMVSGAIAALRDRPKKDLIGIDLGGLHGEKHWEVHDQYKYMVGGHGFMNAMTKLADLTKPKNIPVIIITGSATAEQSRWIDKACSKFGFHRVGIKPYLEKYIKDHNIEDTVTGRQKAFWVSPKDAHPNAAGHIVYAQALADEFKELGIGPK
jgi:hypothetical protein